MGLLKKFFMQTKKPEGFLGKLMVGGMNSGHAKLADWGMSHLDGVSPLRIAELGCGGGRNARVLIEKYPEAKLSALDYSAESVAKARKTNKEYIASGRCMVVQGNVTALPYEKETFDLATAFETVYFWPGLAKCFTEICRIIRPGGVFMICNESDGTDKTGVRFEKIIDGMKCYTAEQLMSELQKTGFSKVVSDHHPDKPWITVLATK